MKLAKLFASLNKKEMKQLRKAIDSPLFNTNPRVVKLFDILRPTHPHLNNELATRKKIFKKVFPEAVFSDQKLRKLYTEFTKVIECFLVYQAVEKNTLDRQKVLANVYQKRGLNQLFNKATNELLQQLSKQKKQSAKHYGKQLELLSMKYYHPSHNKYDLEDSTLVQTMGHLDNYFILSKLRLSVALKSREQVLNEKHDIKLLDAILDIPEASLEVANPLIVLYLQAYKLSFKTTAVNFPTFEERLFSQIANYEPTDQQTLFYCGLNYTIRQSNKGPTNFAQKTFQWYKFGDKQGLLLSQQTIPESHFANAIIAGCKQEDYQWVEEFMKRYLPYLNIANKDAEMDYYYGLFHFLKEDWDKALDLLMQSSHKQLYPPRTRAILCRILLLKYLLNDIYFEPLLAQLNAFEAYIRRDKYFTEGRLNGHLNFILLIRKLARRLLSPEKNSAVKKWFIATIEDTHPILAKQWLIQKIQQLI